MPERQFPTGTIIFKEGDPSDYAYFITSGKVEILKKAGQGDIQLATLGRGQLFGEMGLFDNNPRAASARALEATNVDMIDARELGQLVEQCPPRLVPLLKAVFDRLRATNKRISETEKATEVIGCDYQTITIMPPETDPGIAFEPVVVPVAQLPYRLCGYLHNTHPEREERGSLNIPCEGPPLEISRNHLEIELTDNVVYLTDLGSRYGSWVNGKPIGRGRGVYKKPLPKGDTMLHLGSKQSQYRFLLRCM